MSTATEYHMPGAYYFDSATPPDQQPLSAGIFRPPVSPSASSYNLTGSLYSDISMSTPTNGTGTTTKRKRMSTRESTPMEWNMNMDGANDERPTTTGGADRQIRYTLAGQINATPAGPPTSAEHGILEDSVYSDIDYRRALGPRRVCDEQLDSPTARFANLHPNTSDQPNMNTLNSSGWSTLALHTIGDVVGKVWEFCKNGAFRGFQAGGGQGYELNGTATPLETTGKPWCNEHDVPTLQTDETSSHNHASSLPGQFPQQQYHQQPSHMPFSSAKYHETSAYETTPTRPAVKRRQVSENDELRRNWVLVDEPNSKPMSLAAAMCRVPAPAPAATRPNLTRTRNSGGYYSQTAASSGRRISVPISRISSSSNNTPTRGSLASLRISQHATGSPNLACTAATREPASFAPPRSPVPLSSTPSRIPIPSSHHHSQSTATGRASPVSSSYNFTRTNGAGGSRPSSRQSRTLITSPSPTKGHRRNGSNASVASTNRRATTSKIDVNDIQASPRLTAEAKQLAQKKLAAERDADLRVDAFNAHILKMIQQGKEALGTTVEVYDAAGTPGWEDDD
ncbi:hypothetical protein B0H66DRAFT_253827 [Apodospora peruviana]|uniref:Uncharacterized protein n=1 Tax=Apodospora peruviana TaxID=516989 RepID=A0AAE0I5R8_9PEZI|nr:hypothetical protein B0H66DRAFT_253827 [Apodospora peruviana]